MLIMLQPYRATAIPPPASTYFILPTTSNVYWSNNGTSFSNNTSAMTSGTVLPGSTAIATHDNVSGTLFYTTGNSSAGGWVLRKSTDWGHNWSEVFGSSNPGPSLFYSHGMASNGTRTIVPTQQFNGRAALLSGVSQRDLMYSDDGTNWTFTTVPSFNTETGYSYSLHTEMLCRYIPGPGMFVACKSQTKSTAGDDLIHPLISVSVDGTTWSILGSTPNISCQQIRLVNCHVSPTGVFHILAMAIPASGTNYTLWHMRTSDLANWTLVNLGSSTSFWQASIASDDAGLVVVVGQNLGATIRYSTDDGLSFQSSGSNPFSNTTLPKTVSWTNGVWLVSSGAPTSGSALYRSATPTVFTSWTNVSTIVSPAYDAASAP